jgi:hypothetical protein
VKFSVGVFVDCLISMEKMDWSAIFSEKSGIFKYSAKTVEDIYTLPFTIKTIDLFGLKTCEYEYSWRNTDLFGPLPQKKNQNDKNAHSSVGNSKPKLFYRNISSPY